MAPKLLQSLHGRLLVFVVVLCFFLMDKVLYIPGIFFLCLDES